jgi:hypothetical protein
VADVRRGEQVDVLPPSQCARAYAPRGQTRF